MKKFVLALFAMFALGFAGCSACDGTKGPVYKALAETHADVFGCYPKGYVPEPVLEAEGPKDETPRDFLGNECGLPVYKSPCADCPPAEEVK